MKKDLIHFSYIQMSENFLSSPRLSISTQQSPQASVLLSSTNCWKPTWLSTVTAQNLSACLIATGASSQSEAMLELLVHRYFTVDLQQLAAQQAACIVVRPKSDIVIHRTSEEAKSLPRSKIGQKSETGILNLKLALVHGQIDEVCLAVRLSTV